MRACWVIAVAVLATAGGSTGCELRPAPADRGAARAGSGTDEADRAAPSPAPDAAVPAAAVVLPTPTPTPAVDAAPAPTALPSPAADLAAAAAEAEAAGKALAKRDPEQYKKCSPAAEHAIDIIIAAAPEASRAQLAAERSLRVQELRQVCVEKKWSADGIACLKAAPDPVGIRRCSTVINAPAAAPPGDPGAPAP